MIDKPKDGELDPFLAEIDAAAVKLSMSDSRIARKLGDSALVTRLRKGRHMRPEKRKIYRKRLRALLDAERERLASLFDDDI